MFASSLLSPAQVAAVFSGALVVFAAIWIALYLWFNALDRKFMREIAEEERARGGSARTSDSPGPP